jgi:hypothetical protein
MTCAWQAGRQGFSVIARSSPLFGADAFFLLTERGAHSSTLMQFTLQQRGELTLQHLCSLLCNRERSSALVHLCTCLLYCRTYRRGKHTLQHLCAFYSAIKGGAHSSKLMQFTLEHTVGGYKLFNTYAFYSTRKRELTVQHLCILLYKKGGSTLFCFAQKVD